MAWDEWEQMKSDAAERQSARMRLNPWMEAQAPQPPTWW